MGYKKDKLFIVVGRILRGVYESAVKSFWNLLVSCLDAYLASSACQASILRRFGSVTTGFCALRNDEGLPSRVDGMGPGVAMDLKSIA